MVKASSLLTDLLEIDVFKVGDFMLKGNHPTPFYIDLRHVPSHPRVTNNVVRDIHALVTEKGITAGAVCGVPYNALPFAAVLSSRHEIPMLLKRKEAKSYGTKKLIEGVIVPGTTCLIIEDVVVSGASIKETADALRKEGLIVTDCITILDRLQGGKDNLLRYGIRLHSLYDIEDILSGYSSFAEINPSVVEKVRTYLRNNVTTLQDDSTEIIPNQPAIKNSVFENHSVKDSDSGSCAVKNSDNGNPVVRRLQEIIRTKKSNLCVAADSAVQSSELLQIATAVGPHICMLKTHIDVLKDFDSSLLSKLTSLARDNNFLILEDRKFSDVGPALKHQYTGGMYNIASWADVVTVHCARGKSVLESLKTASDVNERNCLLVAHTDSKDVQQITELARSHSDFVMGFLSRQKLSDDFIHIFPCGSAEEDQQFSSVEEAVTSGADVVVVGKEIYASSDIAKSASEYQNRAYNAYLKGNVEIR